MHLENKRPSASQVIISGDLQKKGNLKARFIAPTTVADLNGELSYKWLNSDEKEGIYEQVIGAYGDMLPLAAASVGKFYKCEITVTDLQGDILKLRKARLQDLSRMSMETQIQSGF